MSNPKIAELIAMSGRATQGEWRNRGEEYCFTIHADNNKSLIARFPGHLKTGSSAKDSRFIAALVNWFRETYTKEQA